jgi:hypothetical protein
MNPLEVVLETRAIKRIEEQVLRWLWTGCTGGYILGPARAGKTTAMEVIKSRIRLRDGSPVPNHFIMIPRRDKKTINSLLRILCLSVNLHVTSNSKSDVLESDFISRIMDEVKKHNSQRFVLFVDEMQRLSPIQLDVFAGLYDYLRELKVALMTVFIGNDDATKSLLEFIIEDQNQHLRGRFFCQKAKFSGLTSVEDVRFCLNQYDQLTYPEPTSLSYTNFFLKDCCLSELKLSTLAPLLWSQFRIYQKAYGFKSWGMQYFRTIVDMLLIDYLPNLETNIIDPELIEHCFELSGILASLVTNENNCV